MAGVADQTPTDTGSQKTVMNILMDLKTFKIIIIIIIII